MIKMQKNRKNKKEKEGEGEKLLIFLKIQNESNTEHETLS